MDDLSDLIQEFLVESYEGLDRLDESLVSLERAPSSKPILAGIFRIIHTIKGSCAFLGFSRLESLSHVGENLLSRLRDEVIPLSPERITALLQLSDAVRIMLQAVETGGDEGSGDHSALEQLLHALALEDDFARPEVSPSAHSQRVSPGDGIQFDEGGTGYSVSFDSDHNTDYMPDGIEGKGEVRLGDLLVAQGRVTADDISRAAAAQEAGDPRRLGEILVDQKILLPGELNQAIHEQQELRTRAAERSLRVDVRALDGIFSLVSELVVARNQLQAFLEARPDGDLAPVVQRVSALTQELQEGVTRTRMQPIGVLWTKLPRMVRDLAIACEKQVQVVLEGADTELDKSVLEALKDPLTHLVRNAIDHGIEPPHIRLAQGKPPEGRLLLRAHHAGGRIHIEIRDDGAGIDPERLKHKALERGLLSEEALAALPPRELLQLIFLPGFSTAERISHISGRGVGMDVVKTNLERIGGVLELQSRVGTGTSLQIQLPLTLALAQTVLVGCRSERFVVPLAHVLEIVRISPHDGHVEELLGVPMLRLRGQLLPLVWLGEALQLPSGSGHADREESADALVVVLQVEHDVFGLVVDEVLDMYEVVVKPLCAALQALKVYEGATVLRDGRIALVLDAAALAVRARVLRAAGVADPPAPGRGEPGAEPTVSLLLLDGGAQGRLAVRLAQVRRLEVLPASVVEVVGERLAMGFRGEVVPLVDVCAALLERRRMPRRQLWDAPGSSSDASVEPRIVVAICQVGTRRAGLIVPGILDVVESPLEGMSPGTRPGVEGTAIVEERLVQLLDLEILLHEGEPTGWEDAAQVQPGG